MDPAGQLYPAVHCVLVRTFGQWKPTGHSWQPSLAEAKYVPEVQVLMDVQSAALVVCENVF